MVSPLTIQLIVLIAIAIYAITHPPHNFPSSRRKDQP